MKSLKELYRVGKGPSSSHTMGPQRAAKLFLERCPNASYYEVTLYGSLAASGKGRLSEVAIEDVLEPARHRPAPRTYPSTAPLPTSWWRHISMHSRHPRAGRQGCL